MRPLGSGWGGGGGFFRGCVLGHREPDTLQPHISQSSWTLPCHWTHCYLGQDGGLRTVHPSSTLSLSAQVSSSASFFQLLLHLSFLNDSSSSTPVLASSPAIGYEMVGAGGGSRWELLVCALHGSCLGRVIGWSGGLFWQHLGRLGSSV